MKGGIRVEGYELDGASMSCVGKDGGVEKQSIEVCDEDDVALEDDVICYFSDGLGIGGCCSVIGSVPVRRVGNCFGGNHYAI